jgi:hypothetical protein
MIIDAETTEETASMIAESMIAESMTVERLDALLPLPKPNLQAMRQQAALGISVVLSLITVINALTFMVISFCGTLDDTAVYTCAALMSTLTAVALACLVGIIFGDPGVIKRSAESSFPLPDEVLQRLTGGFALDDLRNLPFPGAGQEEGAPPKTFCVRCLVWRPHGGHHCKTCQRCVCDFDHHCGVFGRCIAGKLRPVPSGNWPFFTGILLAFFWGAVVGIVFGGFALLAFIQKAKGAPGGRSSGLLTGGTSSKY